MIKWPAKVLNVKSFEPLYRRALQERDVDNFKKTGSAGVLQDRFLSTATCPENYQVAEGLDGLPKGYKKFYIVPGCDI